MRPNSAAPDDERVIKHAALFEIADQRSRRLVRVAALASESGRKSAVLVPATVVKLHESDAAFHKSPSKQAIGSESARLPNVRAVRVERFLAFARHVDEFRHG